MITIENKRNRRGSALLMTYFAALLLSFLVIYGYQSSVTSGNASQVVSNAERTDYAAEYAASLAISELPNVKRGSDGKIIADWVDTNLFTDRNSKASVDQRRIMGEAEGSQFRVLVRSARDAFANGTNPDNWLDESSFNGKFVYGQGNDARFKNTYEILATARSTMYANASADGSQLEVGPLNPAVTRTSSVYGIVEMDFKDNPGTESENFSVLNLDSGQIFNNNKESPPQAVTTLNSTLAFASFDFMEDDACYSIGTLGGVSISGEDHNLTTVFPKLSVDMSGTNITGAQRVTISDGKFVAATGGYWNAGTLTLNFLNDDRGVDKQSIKSATKNRQPYTPVRPNPHVPATRGFTDSYVNSDPGHSDRQMTSKFARIGNINTFYNNDYYSKAYSGKVTPTKTQDRLEPTTLPVDPYFLGGKAIGGAGKTINFQDENLYTRDYDATSDGLYRGIFNPVTNKWSGIIKESKASQFTAAKPLDVVVGSYEDLKRFYITHISADDAKSWRTTFVGEWTDNRYKPGSSSTPAKMLFDNSHSSTVARRRSFSKHFPMNKEGKILVHEMKVYVSGSKSMRDPKNSSETTNVWTGRYRWADVNFGGKFHWVDRKTGVVVYPREFTWEEVTAQKTKRLTTSPDNGLTVAGGVYERNRDTGVITKVSTTVKIEGYPICDSIGREVPELDADDNTIHAGLTEYCSVNASDPKELIPVVFASNPAIDAFGVMTEVKKTGKQTYLNDYKNKVREFARRNFIEVVEDDGSINYYYEISDFEFETEVTWIDDEDVSHTEMRRTAAITVGIEDLPEASSDYDYTDMMFVLNVMPATQSGGSTVVEGDTQSNRFIQWWVLDPEQGLTGEKSKTALSSTQLPNTSMMDEDTRARVNYEWILNNGNSTITAQSFVTKVTDDSGAELTVKYHRAQFDDNGNLIVPEFAADEEREVFYYMATKRDTWSTPHAEKYDDLFAYLAIMTEDSGLNSYLENMMATTDHPELVDEYSGEPTSGNIKRKQIALMKMKERCDSAGVKLVDIRDRVANAGDMIDNFLYYDYETNQEKVDKNLYAVREMRYTSRRYASLIFGGDASSVQVINTDENLNPDYDDQGQQERAKNAQLLFIGGELPPNSVDPIPEAKVTMRQPEGTVLTEDIGQLENGLLPGLVLTAQDLGEPEARNVVDQLYVPLLKPAEVDQIHSLFSVDDNRYQLGWHRSGASLEDAQNTNLLLDCYRAAMLTAKDIQPYTVANWAPDVAPGIDVIAKVKTLVSDGTFTNGVVMHEHLTQIDATGKLPTFTFTARDGAGMDGAGVLVVNGNLKISTQFSYYGLLIVLGDVIVEPAPGMYYRKDASGNFLGIDGDKVYYRSSDRRWFRMAEKQHPTDVDEHGNPLTWSEPDYNDINGNPVEPVMAEQYKGELTVQGQMLVGGDIYVNHTLQRVLPDDPDCPDGNYIVHNGVLNVWASEAARDMVENYLRDGNGNEIGRFSVNKATWNTHPTNAVDHIWNNTLE